MSVEHQYVIVRDDELGYCRLFRADSEECPSTAPLWSGMGLRRGYNAMIRLNNEARPVVTYKVCVRLGRSGHKVFSARKSDPEAPWTTVKTCNTWKQAREIRANLAEKADTDRHNEDLEIMRRTGIVRKNPPRFTDADRRYVAWLRETGRFDIDAA
jgi:hypothetical protein